MGWLSLLPVDNRITRWLTVFCKKVLSNGELTATLRQKGYDSITIASEARDSDITVAVGQVVHVKWRSEFTNPRLIQFHKNRKLSNEPGQHSKVLDGYCKGQIAFCPRSASCRCGEPQHLQCQLYNWKTSAQHVSSTMEQRAAKCKKASASGRLKEFKRAEKKLWNKLWWTSNQNWPDKQDEIIS